MIQVTKVWWDGEKLMAKPIDPTTIYQEPAPDFWEGYVPEPVKPAQQEPFDCGVHLGSGKDHAIKHHVSYGPAQQEPVAWKLVPREPTHEMLKAMDECSTEGYDERLYAGHASSVYMAAVDAAPTPPAQRKPLTDEEIILIVAECAASHQHTDIHFARAIERAHGIKENT